MNPLYRFMTPACLLPALLAGCAPTPPAEPIIRTVEVLVPTPVTCLPENFSVDPRFQVSRADVAAAADAAERLRLLGAGFLERDIYAAEVAPVLRGCK